MNPESITSSLREKYNSIISNEFDLPLAHIGKEKIKAIILGADPTHIVDGWPKKISRVFDLDNKKSPYWRGIKKNLSFIEGLSMDNIHVDNLCKNYFSKETSKNNHWSEIAREYWAPFHKEELDRLYPKNIPVLITTEFILFAILTNQKDNIRAAKIYSQNILFESKTNLLERKVIAFYRHYKYSLNVWPEYARFISLQVNN